MPSVDVQHELAVIFDRLGQIERQIDDVEAELRATAEATGVSDLDDG